MPRDETSASDSSDNEAPEAVSLEASKVAALERRAAELEASKDALKKARQRRKQLAKNRRKLSELPTDVLQEAAKQHEAATAAAAAADTQAQERKQGQKRSAGSNENRRDSKRPRVHQRFQDVGAEVVQKKEGFRLVVPAQKPEAVMYSAKAESGARNFLGKSKKGRTFRRVRSEVLMSLNKRGPAKVFVRK